MRSKIISSNNGRERVVVSPFSMCCAGCMHFYYTAVCNAIAPSTCFLLFTKIFDWFHVLFLTTLRNVSIFLIFLWKTNKFFSFYWSHIIRCKLHWCCVVIRYLFFINKHCTIWSKIFTIFYLLLLLFSNLYISRL